MLEEKLRQAREAFKQKLPARLDELENLIQHAKGAPALDEIREAQHLAHKLCGSAGTFGLPGIHELMRSIDSQLLSVVQHAALPETSFFEEIETGINKVRLLT